MNEFDYHCPLCVCGFTHSFWDRAFPPICPKCGNKDVITTKQHEENRRINAQEAYNESWRE